MMIGVAFSRGDVSIRVTPSIGAALPRWAVMYSSAGSDIGRRLLCVLDGIAEKICERRDFVGRAFDADHRGAVDIQGGPQRGGQLVDGVNVRPGSTAAA